MSYCRERFLKPIVPIENSWGHAVFDIEANNWTQFEMAGFYDGYTYTQHDSIESLTDAILDPKNASKTIFAHNGGKYDFLFIMQELQKRNITYETMPIGASIISLRVNIGDRHYIQIQDSYAILPRSLDNLCETFRPESRKLTGVIDFEKERVSKSNPLHAAYLKADCTSLFEVLSKYKKLPFINRIKKQPTLASAALTAWRTTLKKPIKMTPQYVQNFTRNAYAGGRCEIFKTISDDGLCVDVNSLYPSVMRCPLPLEVIRKSTDINDFGFHRVRVFVPDSTYMPILWQKGAKLIFPTGYIEGTFFSEELKLAVQNGAKILKYEKGYKFSQSTDLFTEFLDECYKLRTDNPGTALDFVGKMLMNNVYGKFAQKELRHSLARVDPKNPATWPKGGFMHYHSKEMFLKTGLITQLKERRSPHMLVHIAAAITAWGRIHMAEKLYLPNQETLAYTDTDSAFLKTTQKTGLKMGELKEEYRYKKALFILPKGYYIELKNGEIIKKIKGFNKKDLKSATYNSFKNKQLSYKKNSILTLKESLIRKNVILAVGEKSRRVISQYDKRKVLNDGSTVPWFRTENGKLV